MTIDANVSIAVPSASGTGLSPFFNVSIINSLGQGNRLNQVFIRTDTMGDSFGSPPPDMTMPSRFIFDGMTFFSGVSISTPHFNSNTNGFKIAGGFGNRTLNVQPDNVTGNGPTNVNHFSAAIMEDFLDKVTLLGSGGFRKFSGTITDRTGEVFPIKFTQPGAPTVDTNAGLAADEADVETITASLLDSNDAGVNDDMIVYSIENNVDFGDLFVDANMNDMVDGGETVGNNGTFTQQDINDGKLKYQHDGSEGASDEFVFTVEDGTEFRSGQVFDITINNINDPPVNTVPGAQTTDEDTDLVFSGGTALSVADPDADLGGGLTVDLTAVNGTLEVATSGATIMNNNTAAVEISGTVAQVNAALATVTYSPTLNFNGMGSVTIFTDDGGNSGAGGMLTDTDVIDITVDPVNDPPVNTVPGPQVTDEDVALVIGGSQLSIADLDAGTGDLTTTLSVNDGTLDVTGGGGGTVMNDGTASVSITGTIAEINAALASVTYLPDPNFNGGDTLTVNTNDNGNSGGPAETDTDLVPITINPINDIPMPLPDMIVVGEDGPPAAKELTTNDFDLDGIDNLEIASVDLTGTIGVVLVNPDNDLVTYDPNGMFESLAAGEMAEDGFSYTVTDGVGGSGTADVTVKILGMNDPVMAVDDSATLGAEDGPTGIDLTGNDIDPDLSDMLQIIALETGQTLGTATIADDWSSVIYDPGDAFSGLGPGETAMDMLSYVVSDGNGSTDVGKLTVQILGAGTPPPGPDANTPPVAADDVAMVGEAGPPLSIPVLGNDTDADADPLTVVALDTSLTDGTASIGPGGTSISYDPAGAFDALLDGQDVVDTLSYTISDGRGGTAQAVVRVTVKGAGGPGANTPPVARDDAVSTLFTMAALGNVLGDNGMGPDTDADADPLSVIAVAGQPGDVGTEVALPSGALFTLAADGGFTYDPNGAFDGLAAGSSADDTVLYSISDGQGGFDTAALTVTVETPEFDTIPGTDGDDDFDVPDLDTPRVLDGQDGDDSANLPGSVEDYDIVPIEGGFRLFPDQGEPIDLLSIETVNFDDATLFTDTSLALQSVFLVYQTFLNREADFLGLTFWKAVLESGFTIDEVADFFPVSPEFETVFGADLSNKEYVETLYQSGLGRDGDAEGCAFWAGLLDDGTLDRGDVGLAFALSDEIRMRFENQIDDGLLVEI